jgi:hypothetical protein
VRECGGWRGGFDHWDSRAEDPQLPTHVVVLNRVQAASDGAWRTLDSRALFKAKVALSELYNGGADGRAERRPRVGLGTAEPSPVRGADLGGHRRREGVAGGVLVTLHSHQHRHRADANGLGRLSREAAECGRSDPAAATGHPANPTRQGLRPLVDLVRGWRTRAAQHLDTEPQAWVGGLAGRCDLPALRAADFDEGMLEGAAAVVVDVVSTRRATFTRSNILAEALRQLHGIRFAAPDERVAVAERVTVLALDDSVQLTPPEVGRLPMALLRPDGTSRLQSRDATIYTTAGVLAAEERLLDAGRRSTRLPYRPTWRRLSPGDRCPMPRLAPARDGHVRRVAGVCAKYVPKLRSLSPMVDRASTLTCRFVAGMVCRPAE